VPIASQIILSQLTPPAQHADILQRKRVASLLAQSLRFPLTLLVAGTGYGKSTSVLSFIENAKKPVFWYSVSPNDQDPVLFLANLCSAFNMGGQNLGQSALTSLEDKNANRLEVLTELANSITAANLLSSILVIDDFQTVSRSEEILRLMNWFIDHLPHSLHMIIVSRVPLAFPSLPAWRMKNRVLEIGRDQLIFTKTEINDLFNSTYKIKVDEDEGATLQQKTEGWAIGLQVVWQSLKSHPDRDLQSVLGAGFSPNDDLFTYLAQEVLEKLPQEQRDFLIQTSILNIFDSDTCDFLLSKHNSQGLLTDLYRSGLFIEALSPGIFRYHNIFKEFLLSRLRLTPAKMAGLHQKAASYFAASHSWEQAVHHMLEAGDFSQVARVISDIGEKLISDGRSESLQNWIGRIPPSTLRQFPYIYYLSGSVERLSSRFEQALEQFRTAGRLFQAKKNAWGESLALRGQAQVYLDTIRPKNANQLLSKALELLDLNESPAEAATLLTQLAENQVNQGEPSLAASNLVKAEQLEPFPSGSRDFIRARLLLRTGQLAQGISLLQILDAPVEEAGPVRPQRFHREASLLLSLFHAFTGDHAQSIEYARKGLRLGSQLRSPFVTAVGNMRIGHAFQLDPASRFIENCLEAVAGFYEKSMQIVDIVRIHVEPLWGLIRLYGYAGQVEKAQSIAQRALSIASESGDKWIATIIQISLGAGYALAGQYETANKELSIAESIAREVEDTFAETAASLWLAYTAWKQGFTSSFLLYIEQALALVSKHNYQFLFTKPTILGSNDPTIFVPLLLAAKADGVQPETASQLLDRLDCAGLAYHPGSVLKISTLGRFEVMVGDKYIEGDRWKREKSRQMLQILSAAGDKGMSRDQICLILWPDASPQEAANSFKVVLNALNQSLEPDRTAGVPAFYVKRTDDIYQLRSAPHVLIDHILFEQNAVLQKADHQETAFNLYLGHLLANELVQESFLPTEHYLHRLFLDTASKLGNKALDSDYPQKAILIGQKIIQIDPYYEDGYALQMKAYSALDNLSMMRTIYQQAQQFLTSNDGPGTSKSLDQLRQQLSEASSSS